MVPPARPLTDEERAARLISVEFGYDISCPIDHVDFTDAGAMDMSPEYAARHGLFVPDVELGAQRPLGLPPTYHSWISWETHDPTVTKSAVVAARELRAMSRGLVRGASIRSSLSISKSLGTSPSPLGKAAGGRPGVDLPSDDDDDVDDDKNGKRRDRDRDVDDGYGWSQGAPARSADRELEVDVEEKIDALGGRVNLFQIISLWVGIGLDLVSRIALYREMHFLNEEKFEAALALIIVWLILSSFFNMLYFLGHYSWNRPTKHDWTVPARCGMTRGLTKLWDRRFGGFASLCGFGSLYAAIKCFTAPEVHMYYITL